MMPSRAAFARCAPFGVFIAFLVLGSLLSDPPSWLSVARAVAVALVLAWFWSDYRELREGLSVPFSQWASAVAAGVAVFLAWIWIDWDWAVVSRPDGFDPRAPDGGDQVHPADRPVQLRVVGPAVVDQPAVDALYAVMDESAEAYYLALNNFQGSALTFSAVFSF